MKVIRFTASWCAPCKMLAKTLEELNTDIEIEVDTLQQLGEVLPLKPDLVLLDNMTPAQCAEAVAIAAGSTELEASGGISLENAKAYAESGVNYLAIGALTHSAPVLDIGLDVRAE